MAVRQKMRFRRRSMHVDEYTDQVEAADSEIQREKTRQQHELKKRLRVLRKNTMGEDILEGDTQPSPNNEVADEPSKSSTESSSSQNPEFKEQNSSESMNDKADKIIKPVTPTETQKLLENSDKKAPPPQTQAQKNVGKKPLVRHSSEHVQNLLTMDRIPTPDLTISAEESEKLRNTAATEIQAAYRGYRVRRKSLEKVSEEKKLEAIKEKDQSKHRATRGKSGTVRVKTGSKLSPALSPTPSNRFSPSPETSVHGRASTSSKTPTARSSSTGGRTLKTELVRQTSRFSHKGIEDRRLVDEAYDIKKKIGDGNFAVVKQCIHRNSGKQYALKIIDKSKTRGVKETKMIENEVKTMRTIDHPNCVALIDVYDTPEELFLVLELVEGGDLFDRIVEKGKYEEPAAKLLVRDLATAIQHMHSKQIIHRDLKPENLLVTVDNNGYDRIKLADFGLSLVVDKPLHTVCGTPTYVAPEIISETPEGYGLKVDLWATGVIAYILLCGFPPFAAANKAQNDLFRKIRSGKFSFPSPYWDKISHEAKDLIRKLLLVNPKERYDANQLLAHPWLASASHVSKA
eukprot:m.173781 g.173781  ORF g.173781 m.173781 type:complete len:573 (-) comp15394_c2_seq1:70-1788(-)